MSDCSTRAWRFKRTWGDTKCEKPKPSPKREGGPTGKLHAKYDSGNDWDYPIVLNGRTMLRLDVALPEGHPQVDIRVNGARYVPAPRRDWDEGGTD